jgi:hypothetical protein
MDMSSESNHPPFGLVEPEPTPEVIRTIPDLAQRQRATEAWTNASLLHRLSVAWEHILLRLSYGQKQDSMRATLITRSIEVRRNALYQ